MSGGAYVESENQIRYTHRLRGAESWADGPPSHRRWDRERRDRRLRISEGEPPGIAHVRSGAPSVSEYRILCTAVGSHGSCATAGEHRGGVCSSDSRDSCRQRARRRLHSVGSLIIGPGTTADSSRVSVFTAFPLFSLPSRFVREREAAARLQDPHMFRTPSKFWGTTIDPRHRPLTRPISLWGGSPPLDAALRPGGRRGRRAAPHEHHEALGAHGQLRDTLEGRGGAEERGHGEPRWPSSACSSRRAAYRS